MKLTCLGKITAGNVGYELNDEFKEQATQLSDYLLLDQVESAKLLIYGGRESESLDRSPFACAVIAFHRHRSFLLESLRLALKIALDLDAEPKSRQLMQAFLVEITKGRDPQRNNGEPLTPRRCMSFMSQIEQRLNTLAEQVQKAITVGQVSTPDFEEIMGHQQQNLAMQHESIGTILSYLVKLNYSSTEDFHALLGQMRTVDKWNSSAVHYVPALISYCTAFGSNEGNAAHQETRSVFVKMVEAWESNPWPIRHLQAATMTWWLAEYNSWYSDQPEEPSLEGVDAEKDAEVRTDTLEKALRDGGFQCTLSICSQIKSSDWYDPARIGLIQSLLNDAPVLPFEPASMSAYFRDVVMEQFESFTYSFISNMPDMLRKFKVDEEDQRRTMLSTFQPNMPSDAQSDRHLERFFVIMSYAYEGRPDAANSFWVDPESNLYGFLQWFSRRVSTPLIGAFCEMFRAISEGEECASSAHAFLLEEESGSSSRIRRSTSLTWAQIFEELDFYAQKIRENPTTSLSTSSAYGGKSKPIDIDEPETPVMLECYLRLTSHLCAQSGTVRSWILSHQSFHLVDTVFLLCNNAVPSRIRACAYSCLSAVLTAKTAQTGNFIWMSLDHWVSNGFWAGSVAPRSARQAGSTNWVAEDVTFEAISTDFDEMTAFVTLLQSLVSPSIETADFDDSLPFPEQLGSTYRMPGIEPYIDLVMGNIFALKVLKLESPLQSRILASKALRFAEICLETFNENLLILVNKTGINPDTGMNASSFPAYVRLHPFGRTIEWLFNERVISTLFVIAHQDISEINIAQSDSPVVVALLRAIKIINLVMDLQATYLDIVRPLIKSSASNRSTPVLNPSMASFEDCVSVNVRIINDLAYYCGSGHHELALISMELLKKFSVSRKLNVSQLSKLGNRVMINRLVGALQQNNDVEPISRSLAQAMTFDEKELLLGPAAPEFNVKFSILNFLKLSLSTHPDKPGVAHALLGFDCDGRSVSIKEDGLFMKRSSLYHSILRLSLEYPGNINGSMMLWALTLRSKAARIVKILWASPLTSTFILTDMRQGGAFFPSWLSLVPIDAETIWEGWLPRNKEFLFSDGARALEEFLRFRHDIVAYAGTALRSVAMENTPTLRAKIISTILGMTVVEEEEISNLTVYDLLDFLEIELIDAVAEPILELLTGLDFGSCIVSTPDEPVHFDLKLIEELCYLRRNQLRKSGTAQGEVSEEKFVKEKQDVLSYINGMNNAQSLDAARIAALQVWADLITLLVEDRSIEPSDKTTLVIRAFQVILPKLEAFAYANRPEALILAKLVQNLLSQMDFTSPEASAGRSGELSKEKLHQLFKISLRTISMPDTDVVLREVLYNICFQCLVSSTKDLKSHTQNAQAMKVAGEGLIDVVSEDAYSGIGTTRVAALLLLDSLTALASKEKSPYVIETLVRSNFIVVMVEAIKDIPDELRATGTQGKDSSTAP